jgi:hypothetical protein
MIKLSKVTPNKPMSFRDFMGVWFII